MIFSKKLKEISKWIPLITKEWGENNPIAATIVPSGTDVNYWQLTEEIAEYLENQKNVEVHYNTYVDKIEKKGEEWSIKTKNKDKVKKTYRADNVLSAAWWGAIQLLKKSGIPQAKNFASFPIGWGFLMTEAENISDIHNIKAYSKAEKWNPPMSVPHLDIRYVNGKTYILFGPFALFNLKMSKNGSFMEYLKTLRLHDTTKLLKSSTHNVDLIKYLAKETYKARSKEDLIKELEKFAPWLGSKEGFDWKFIRAGQRVQIIEDGELNFGTKMVYSDDGRYASLLWASPWASVSPDITKEWVEKTYPELTKAPAFKEIFPEPDKDILRNDPERYYEVKEKVNKALGI